MEKGLESKAVKRFNRIMRELGLEYLEVGESGEGTQNWNLRDLVAECDYQLSTYYEGGHWNCDLYACDYKEWLSEVNKLKRFIKAYIPFIQDIKVTEKHSSKFDN